MQLNKIHNVTTIARFAAELGEDEDLLSDIAADMEPEDGLIWVCGIGDDVTTGSLAFSRP